MPVSSVIRSMIFLVMSAGLSVVVLLNSRSKNTGFS